MLIEIKSDYYKATINPDSISHVDTYDPNGNPEDPGMEERTINITMHNGKHFDCIISPTYEWLMENFG